MRIELRIDRLIVNDLGACSPEELVAAITQELRLVLARDGGRLRADATTSRSASVPRLRTAPMPHPAGAGATSTGRAIGATLAAAVISDQLFPRIRGHQ